MPFSTREREFLRLAALADPDWATMQVLLSAGLDYESLKRDALAHQLDGVVAWRLLDERVAELVPASAREDCQRRLDWLAEYNRIYWEEVQGFCAMLKERDIEHAVQGGPAQYAPLGIDVWPRTWGDADIAVRISTEAEMQAIADASGAVKVTRWSSDAWLLHFPGGTRIDLENTLPWFDGVKTTWKEWQSPSINVSVFGVEIMIRELAQYVLYMASSTRRSMIHAAARLPLWGLARLANWIARPDWSWKEFGRLLNDEIVACDQVESEARHLWRPTELAEVSHVAGWALCSLEIADRVYGILPNDVTLDSLVPARRWRASILDVVGGPIPEYAEEYVCQFCEWVQYPGDEAFLFDYAEVEGLEARLKAGLWRLCPDSRPETWQRDPKKGKWYLVDAGRE